MNGYTGRAALARFTRSIKLRLEKRDQIAPIARLVGLEEKVLFELIHRHRRVPNAHSRPSHFAIRCFHREPYTAYCPQCVRERGIFRAIWNFRAVTVCEQHGLWLVEQCPKCSKLVGWDRPQSTLCTCGFGLAQTETSPAPIEAVLVNQLLVATVLDTRESDFLEQQLFCAEARQMGALEWLAVANFLATIAGGSLHFHPTARATLDTERRATLLAAKLFANWPANAMQELNRTAQSATDGWQSPLITFRQLTARAPTRHTSRRRGVMALPSFMTSLLESYVDALAVDRQGLGLAVNPDRVVASANGTLGVRLHEAKRASAPAASDDRDFVPLPDLIRGIREAKIVVYSNREAEQLIGATRSQRTALVRSGLLHDRRQFLLSSDIDRLLRWLQDNSAVTTEVSNMVLLSELAPTGRVTLQRVMTAAVEGRIQLFRQFDDSARLDTCFVKRSSLAALVR